MIEANIKGFELKFKTSDAVFSPRGIDKGTLEMLADAEFGENDKVLDLGCGYGAVGIVAAKTIGADRVFMIDIDMNAVELAMENAELNHAGAIEILQSDGFRGFREKDFTLILSNPPYHTDFSVAKEFIEKGFNRLVVGGKMIMVTKRKDWYKNKFIAIFGGVKIREAGEYFIFSAIKKDASYARTKSGK
jgi:16S rRNA (guanine1207-N2)-methyltransferase